MKDPFRVLILICTMKLNRLFLVSVPALCLAFSFCSSGSRKADDDIPLPASVDVPHVAEGDYADMSRPNLTFTADKIVCNYPVESHVYVIDRRSGQTNVFEAPSRYTANKAEPCRSRTDYTQWERHRVENPHFYELMYLPASGRYVRLHTAGQTYDASKKLMDQLLENVSSLPCSTVTFQSWARKNCRPIGTISLRAGVRLPMPSCSMLIIRCLVGRRLRN